jgi:hypothetical protein
MSAPEGSSRLVTKHGHLGQPSSHLTRRVMPHSGSEMGAVRHRQVRADAVTCSQTIICWPFVGETGPRARFWERDGGYCFDRLRNLVIPAAAAEGRPDLQRWRVSAERA